MVEEGGVKKFLWDSCLFSLLIDFVILVIHLIFPQTILRLEIKMTNCADYQWYVWLKKMNIETTQYVYHEFQKRRGCRSPCKGRGGTRRENDTPLQTMLVCNLVFAIRWDKLFPFDSFFNEIQLTEKLFSEVFIKFLSTL